jgi:hypothetical protein
LCARVLVKEILSGQNQNDALRFYTSEILNPELTDKAVLSIVEALDVIDEMGI